MVIYLKIILENLQLQGL